MKKPIKQRVYVREIHHYDWLVKSHNDDLIDHVKQSEGYFFTPEQLNEYTANVINQALETAAEKALLKTEYIDDVYDSDFEDTALPNEAIFLRTDDDGIPYAANKVVVNKKSITNTFDETYKKFEAHH